MDDPGRAEALLRRAPFVEHVAREGDTLLLTIPGDHAFALGRLLAEHGLAVGELRRQERDLEQFFLTMTGEAAPTVR